MTMTDTWNVAEGKTPHDKAMSYAASTAAETDLDPNSDFAKLYSEGLRVLESNRFVLVRNPLGAHCGHDAYIRSKPVPLKGITYPHWFRTLRLIESQDEENMLVSALIKSPASYGELLEFWSPLTLPVSGQKSSKLLGYVERLQRVDESKRKQNESLPFELGIQTTSFTEAVAKSEQAPRAFVPPRDWFAPQVQQLTFADVFTLWPTAELRMLELILGRGCTGRSNSKQVGEDGVLEHTFRSVGIVIGEDAGLGKSTVFDKLARATNIVGYRWANFRNISEQFGLGDIATADFAYKDDLVGPTLSSLISSENTKIIASGGKLYVEDKFQKGSSVYARCVLLANTNEWNPRAAYNLDPGTVDRIKLLTTFRRVELETECRERASDLAKDSPSFAPFIHIPWLANKLDVSEETILLWACRLAVDKFAEFTFVRGELPTEALRLEVHDISSRMRYSFNKDCTRALVSAMLLSHILFSHLANVHARRKPYVGRELNAAVLKEVFSSFRKLVTDKGMFRLRGLIKLHWEQNNRPDTHPWSAIRKLNFPSVRESDNAFSMATSAKADLPTLVREVFSNLRLRDGFTGSHDIVWVTAAWQACQGYLPNLEALARQLESIVLSNEEAFSSVTAASGRAIVDDSWLESSDYSPRQIDTLLNEQDANFDLDVFAETLQAVTWDC